MNALRSNPFLVGGLRLIVGFVFLIAAIDKIAEPSAFATSVGNYKLVGQFIAMCVATVLPWMELLCGLGLIFGIYRRGSALLTSTLLFAFTIAVSIALARGLDISCGCFTQDPAVGKISVMKIVENVVLMILSIFLLVSNSRRFSLEERIRGTN